MVMYCLDMTTSPVSTKPHLESQGSGPSLVLLHANGGDHRDFKAVAPSFVESGWRVTTLDWPGHGESPRSEPETAVGFGELLARTLDELGGEHVLLGNSVGGFAALYAAARRPDRLAGLVLVSPGGFSSKSGRPCSRTREPTATVLSTGTTTTTASGRSASSMAVGSV